MQDFTIKNPVFLILGTWLVSRGGREAKAGGFADCLASAPTGSQDC